MTVPVLKIKVLPKPVIKGKMGVRFPANVAVDEFLTVDRANGTYTFGVDYTKLGTSTDVDAANFSVAVLDQIEGTYKRVYLSSIGTGTITDHGDIRRYGAIANDAGFDNHQAITDALSDNDKIYVPPGTWYFGSQILPSTGKTIYGAGKDVSILRAMSASHNGIMIQDADKVTVHDLTLIGVFDPVGFDTGGIGLVRANYCTIDDVRIDSWSAQGLALRFATYNQVGNIITTNNGDRGVNCSALSHHNTFGEIIATGNGLAAFLIGYGCYKNNVTSVIGGGHTNAAVWIMNDCYENIFGSVNIAAPAAGFEDNAAVVIAWHSYQNQIGNVIAKGYRRGIQFKAANTVPSGDPDIDPFLTEGGTGYNSIGFAYIETDNGTDAACIYMDSADSRTVNHNRIGFIHGRNATYGVWDTIGDSDANSFGDQTWVGITTPFSLPSFGTNTGLFRNNSNWIGIDCQNPSGVVHARRSVSGDHTWIAENSNNAATTNKTVSFQGWHRDTVGTQKVGGGLYISPLDNDAINTKVEIKVSRAGSIITGLAVHADGSVELPVLASDPGGTAGRIYGNSATLYPKYNDGSFWRSIALLEVNNTWSGSNTFTGTPNINASAPVLNIRDTDSPGTSGTICATINLRAFNSAGTDKAFAQMNGVASSVTAGSENGQYRFATLQAGTLDNRFIVGAGVTVGTSAVVDQGAGTINISADYYRGGTKIVGARDTGWTAMTGTANKNTAYDTASVTLAQLAGRVMSLQAALTTHGLLGA